jgi:hypothetical protein
VGSSWAAGPTHRQQQLGVKPVRAAARHAWRSCCYCLISRLHNSNRRPCHPGRLESSQHNSRTYPCKHMRCEVMLVVIVSHGLAAGKACLLPAVQQRPVPRCAGHLELVMHGAMACLSFVRLCIMSWTCLALPISSGPSQFKGRHCAAAAAAAAATPWRETWKGC